MILAVDVQYQENSAQVAGVLFEHWHSVEPRDTLLKVVKGVAPYEPGAFYKRELPCILSLVEDLSVPVEIIVIDGFVTLGGEGRKGLGMHLFEALDQKVAVVGVAKRFFKDTPKACEVLRGDSAKPLYVTAAGMPLASAISGVAAMHGAHRIPSLLKRADQLCRGIEA